MKIHSIISSVVMLAIMSATVCSYAQNGTNSPYSRYGFG